MLPRNKPHDDDDRRHRSGDSAAPAPPRIRASRQAPGQLRAQPWRRSRQSLRRAPASALRACAERSAHRERRVRQRWNRDRQRARIRESPVTATRTCHAPAVIIHRLPVNSRGSAVDRDAQSGTGANCAPGPVNGSGTMRTSSMSSLVVSTSTSATPGIAYGGLTVTSSLYVAGAARPRTRRDCRCARTRGVAIAAIVASAMNAARSGWPVIV